MMKNYFLLSLAAIALLTAGCEKDKTDNVSKTLKVPTIEIIGGDYTPAAIGSAYVDQGATFTDEDGTQTTIQPVEGAVTSTTEPGLYFLTYRKKSKSGIFEAEAVRVVAVGAYTGPSEDYTGEYLRVIATNPQTAYVTKVGPGIYRIQNPGGAVYPHTLVVVYIIQTGPNTFVGPHQEEHLVGEIELDEITITSTGSSWRIYNQYYGTGLRSFIKQ